MGGSISERLSGITSLTKRVLAELRRAGIDLKALAVQLQDDGAKSFRNPGKN